MSRRWYHDGHLYATAWTAATLANKEKALVMATRLIDAECQFNGIKVMMDQVLQWPRELCPSPDDADVLPVNTVPKCVLDATCEMARELLVSDRTAAPLGEGVKYINDGTTQTGYDKRDTRPVVSHVAQALLAKVGAVIKSWSGVVRLVRG